MRRHIGMKALLASLLPVTMQWELILVISYGVDFQNAVSCLTKRNYRAKQYEKAYSIQWRPCSGLPPPCHNGSQSWSRPLPPPTIPLSHALNPCHKMSSSSPSLSRSKSHFKQILNWQLLDIWGFNRTARFKLGSKCPPTTSPCWKHQQMDGTWYYITKVSLADSLSFWAYNRH